MATRFVNQMTLDNGIRPPRTGQVSYRVRHCPALYLRVSATGAMSWKLMYRVGGKQIKETLRGAPLPRLDAAVRWAQEIQAKVRAGVNPVAERRAAAERTAANTVAAAVERYMAEHVEQLRPATRTNYKQVFEHDVLPRWGARPLADIGRADVLVTVHDKSLTAPVSANRILSRVRAFFGWCIAHDLLAVDPSLKLRKPSREKSRDRTLDDDEVRRLWAATAGEDEWSVMFRLALLTAARRSELAGMRWGEIDIDARVWEIPGSRTKNARPHTIHLSELALAELSRIERRGESVFGRISPTSGGFSRALTRVGAEDWSMHDLRRTACSTMARIGIAPHIADRILNHQTGTLGAVARTYNRYEYLSERRAALEALSRFIAELVGGGDGNVVQIRRA